jgi:uncharacterized protein (DUF302 family)
MLQASSDRKLDAMEAAVRWAANRNGAVVLSLTHVGQLLRDTGNAADAIVFTICEQRLYAEMLAAEIRMSALLPCRIAAYSQGGRTMLEAISPLDFCRLIGREDLAPQAAPLEKLLRTILEEAAQSLGIERAASTAERTGGLGATEEQMNTRGAIPQRIDCHGTKVEELAGTGEHDAQGG